MKLLAGLALAVLLCAALDTNLTRAAYTHRPQDWLLPAQALALWAGWGLLLALPVRLTRALTAAGLSAALAWLAGAVVVHHVLAARRASDGAFGLWQDGPAVFGAVAAIVVFVLVAGRLERLALRGERRWPAYALGALALAALLPRGGAPGRTPEHSPALPPLADHAPAGATPPSHPNLLLLVWDTTRADHLSSWGYERETTPALARLAQQSTVFENCWSASVFTLSSHVSMLTGLPPALHGSSLRRQLVTAQTVAPLLARAGYRTGAFVGTAVLTGSGGLRDGFDVYDDRVDPPVCDTHLWALVNDAQVLASKRIPALRGNGQPHWWQDFQRPADDVLAAADTWIREGGEQPWFALVNVFDTHWPYEPSVEALARWARPYAGPLTGHLFRADDWPAGRAADTSDAVHARDLYDGELWDLDRAVGAFLGGLELESGTTALLLTADHGEALGEHGEWSHEHPRVPQARVPLLICAPGRVPAGARVASPVSGLDVAPTLLELAGVAPPPGFAAGGRSLLAPELPAERLLFVQDHDNEFAEKDEDAVVKGRFKLLRTATSSTLHDALTDPMDEIDIAALHPELVLELGAALDALQAAAPEPGASVMDEDALRALGYVGH